MSKRSIETPEDILEEKIDKIHRRREWKHFVAECIVIVVAIYIIFNYVIGIAFVSGNSMEPTLADGELMVFYRLDESYEENDLVVIMREDNLEYIKRIVATEGDIVEWNEEGTFLINGAEEDRPFVLGDTQPMSEEISYPYEIPAGEYFVLGDNREDSRDSRTFGAVKEAEIIGRVFLHVGFTK